jgi:hypothetical protein
MRIVRRGVHARVQRVPDMRVLVGACSRVNRAGMNPRRFDKRGGKPECPKSNQGAEPRRASHRSIIQQTRDRFTACPPPNRPRREFDDGRSDRIGAVRDAQATT